MAFISKKRIPKTIKQVMNKKAGSREKSAIKNSNLVYTEHGGSCITFKNTRTGNSATFHKKSKQWIN